jgi:hypothetical protein
LGGILGESLNNSFLGFFANLFLILALGGLGAFLGGFFLLVALSSTLDIIFYFSTKLLYNLAGLPITILFWLIWLGSFFLLYTSGKRLERHAQNPLYGLLEPSGAAVSPRRGWLLIGDKIKNKYF